MVISWRLPFGAASHSRRMKLVSGWSISANRCAAPVPISSVASSNGGGAPAEDLHRVGHRERRLVEAVGRGVLGAHRLGLGGELAARAQVQRPVLDVLRRPLVGGDHLAGALDEDADGGLVHDPVVDALEPVLVPAEHLVVLLDEGARLHRRVGADVQLLRALQRVEQLDGAVHGPAAALVDLQVDRDVDVPGQVDRVALLVPVAVEVVHDDVEPGLVVASGSAARGRGSARRRRPGPAGARRRASRSPPGEYVSSMRDFTRSVNAQPESPPRPSRAARGMNHMTPPW